MYHIPDDSRKKVILEKTYAAEYLCEKGYHIIERNWHTRYAEIDIVATGTAICLVIVEVKTRYDDQYGTPESAMTQHKIATLKRSAYLYSSQHPELPSYMRIDFCWSRIQRRKCSAD